MVNELMRSFSVLNGLYASIQEACDLHKVTQNSVIPENLEGLFDYLSKETCQEIKLARVLVLELINIKNKDLQLSAIETDKIRKGLKTIANLFNNYGWLFVKTNTINVGIDSLAGHSELFKQ